MLGARLPRRALLDGAMALSDPGAMSRMEIEAHRRPIRGGANAGPAETIFWGGPILPVAGPLPEVEALAVRDGRIVAVGARGSVQTWQGPSTTVVDLDGRTLLPGFIESHLHVLTGALAKVQLEVSPFTTTSFDHAIQKVKAAVDAAAPGAWVLAWGYDPSLIAGPPQITIQDLDPISPNNPVFILNLSEHIAYVNSRALAAAGITRDTQDVAGGGRYLRDASGNPNGVIQEAAAIRTVFAAFPPMPAAEVPGMIRGFTSAAAAAGCTTITDAGVGALHGVQEAELFRQVASAPDAPVRLRGFPFGPLFEEWQKTPGFAPGVGDDRFRLVKIKFQSDGSNQGYTAAQRQPYLNTTSTGFLDYNTDELQALIAKAIEQGWPVSVHCNGDAGLEQVLGIFAALQGTSPRGDLRHRIEHFTVNDESQVEQANRLGLTPSFTIGHVYYWGKAFRDTILGPERAARLDPTASWMRRGRPFSLHCDSITTPLAPLSYIQTAVTRRMRDGGEVLGPDQCIPVDEAIKAVTSYPAWQLNMDDIAGSLEVGKYADLAILDKNPRTVDPDTIAAIKVTETWLAGVRSHGPSS
jgi:predicted amidohydrolase YtcJ